MDEIQASAQDRPDPEPDAAWRKSVEERFRVGDRLFKSLRSEMKANTEITSEIRDVVLTGKSLFKFAARVGRFFVWCGHALYAVMRVGGVIAAAGTAIWAAVWAATHGGSAPPKP